MSIYLEQVISGGQTGVDQVGLKIAKALGYQTGGTAPQGWRTDEGSAAWLADYGLTQSPQSGYHNRTIDNVRNSDFTVWFGDVESPGGQLTRRAAVNAHKPFCCNPSGTELRGYLESDSLIRILNVAGNRLRTNPAASVQAEAVLQIALSR